MDSSLLDEIAKEGNGNYAFIPDISFVGTIFIHAVSNFLTTCGQRANFNFETLNGAKVN